MTEPLSTTKQSNQRSHAFKGIAFIIAGSLMLASKGIFAKLLYARGLNFETVSATRAVLAIPGFILLATFLGGVGRLEDTPARDVVKAIIAGIVCYAIGASANFYALTLIDASVERALLYSYPSMVVLATWFISGRRPGLIMTSSLIVTYIGIALVVGAFNRSLLQANWVGGLWVLLCSSTIAYYFIVSGKLTRTMGSARFTVIAMTAAGLAMALNFQVRHGWHLLHLEPTDWALMLALVVLATVLPLFFIAEGLRRIGPQRAAIASTIGPPTAAIMAIYVLGESIRIGQVIGILMIVTGIVILELRMTKRPK